jgi:aryl-alcohol dehydrogenase
MINFNVAVVREQGGAFVPQLVELWQHGRFLFDRLIRKYSLAEIEKAAHASETDEVLKAILVPVLA